MVAHRRGKFLGVALSDDLEATSARLEAFGFTDQRAANVAAAAARFAQEETDSIIPHLTALEGHKLQPDYCSANDPEAAFECLERTRDTLGADKKMFVAPIGPKPCGIASAIFASAYPEQVGLLFDHPRRKKKRSSGIDRWHRFTVTVDRSDESAAAAPLETTATVT